MEVSEILTCMLQYRTHIASFCCLLNDLTSLQMGVEDLAGIPSSAEGGFFDPFQLSKGKDEETINWYRSAELKHGRISMLATLGIVIQGYNTKIIPGFPVTDTNAINALKKVYYEAPSALVQVCIASPIESNQLILLT
jgi:Chlorophyll A-B binding protein